MPEQVETGSPQQRLAEAEKQARLALQQLDDDHDAVEDAATVVMAAQLAQEWFDD